MPSTIVRAAAMRAVLYIEAQLQMQFLLDDGDQRVGCHDAPNLRLDRVLAGAQKTLYAQVLLDST
jgi:hypothetical protein